MNTTNSVALSSAWRTQHLDYSALYLAFTPRRPLIPTSLQGLILYLPICWVIPFACHPAAYLPIALLFFYTCLPTAICCCGTVRSGFDLVHGRLPHLPLPGCPTVPACTFTFIPILSLLGTCLQHGACMGMLEKKKKKKKKKFRCA